MIVLRKSLKFSLGLLFAFAVLFPLRAQTWNLVWSDEFNNTGAPDPSKWGYDIGGGGWGNGELQYYTNRPENARVENGHLIIEARPEIYGGNKYTSARLNSRNKGDWQYGKIVVRAKIPSGKGTWPAIWMMPTDNVYGGWPRSGEIDIMECWGAKPNIIAGSLHFGTRDIVRSRQDTIHNAKFADAYHIFQIIWEPGAILFYRDDTLYHTATKWVPDNSRYPAPFDKRFFLILNLAVDFDSAAVFPARMEVDYVRVYQGGKAGKTPFLDRMSTNPLTIEAEDFDLGGESVAYHDADPSNKGGYFRTWEGVDLDTVNPGYGFSIGSTTAGEWLDFTGIPLAKDSTYTFEAVVSAAVSGTRFAVTRDEIATDTFVVPAAGSRTWSTMQKTGLVLSKGMHSFRVRIISGGLSIDKFRIRYQAPAAGLAIPVRSNGGPKNEGLTVTPNAVIYELAQAGEVTLKLFNANGQTLGALATGFQPAGNYRVRLGTAGMGRGLCLIVLNRNGKQIVKRFVAPGNR